MKIELESLPKIGTRQEFARALGVCSRTLHRWELRNELQPIRPNANLVLYTRIGILRFLAERGILK
jgi:hypothetical protein